MVSTNDFSCITDDAAAGKESLHGTYVCWSSPTASVGSFF